MTPLKYSGFMKMQTLHLLKMRHLVCSMVSCCCNQNLHLRQEDQEKRYISWNSVYLFHNSSHLLQFIYIKYCIVSMLACFCVHVHACTCTCVCVSEYICVHVYLPVWLSIYLSLSVDFHVYVCTCMCVFGHTGNDRVCSLHQMLKSIINT